VIGCCRHGEEKGANKDETMILEQTQDITDNTSLEV